MIDYTKETEPDVKSTVEKLTEDPKKNKWVVLSVIDDEKILAEKLKIEYEDYIILDSCNPGLAHRGLTLNKQPGMILPRKIIVYADKGKTKVSLYKPTVSLSTASSPPGYDELKRLEIETENGLNKIIDLQ